MVKTNIFTFILVLGMAALLSSCGGAKNLIVPRAVNTANSISAQALNLNKDDYDILASVTETASVIVNFSGNKMRIDSGEGEFNYTFEFNNKNGWVLKSFNGTAIFGYLQGDASNMIEIPQGEEFARRVAIARLIEVVKDYNADGVLDPIVTTRASNSSKNTVEYQASATAKIVNIHSTSK